ncbi:MAG: N-acetylmuramoyl-L-alanine amidase [Muribaculaceae bacterium]|nr:N-acetylmuramoyl-L-alanine amidase [Muribaculaceae bacterium]
MTVILDNGHGCDTPGKSSPDGRHREWQWCRRAVSAIADGLVSHGVKVEILVPESRDVSLRERTERVRKIVSSSAGDCILVSVHNNAAGDGSEWRGARGWSVFVAPSSSAKSVRLARLMYDEACRQGLMGNRATPADGYWVASLAICRDTPCPAVLTENLFQDNRDDVAVLESVDGFESLVSIHVNAILNFINML